MNRTLTLLAGAAVFGAVALTAAPAQAQDCSGHSGASVVYDDGYDDAHYDRHERTTRQEQRATAKARRLARRLVRSLDGNGDGYISQYEARQNHSVYHAFDRIDRNRDGYLASWELEKAMRGQSTRTTRARVSRVSRR